MNMNKLGILKQKYAGIRDGIKNSGTLDEIMKIDEKSYQENNAEFENIEKIYGRGNDIENVEKALERMEILDGKLKNLRTEMKSLKDFKEDAERDNTLNGSKKDKSNSIEKEVKSYIKSKIGNFGYFSSRVAYYSKNYKNEEDFIPLKEMREIYGTKGALMMMCNLENGKIKGYKLLSAYRRICNKILKEYRSLKVEAAITALESGYLKTGSFKDEDIDELNGLLYKLYKLECKSKSSKNPEDKFLENPAYAREKFEIKPKSEGFNFLEAILSTETLIKRLKNTKGRRNEERKKLINMVVKKIEKMKEDYSAEADSVNKTLGKINYLKKYDDFIEKSSKLALNYLKSEGKIKIKRFNIVDNGGKYIQIFGPKRDFCMDTCKIALMSLVAVCSKNKSNIKKGLEWFKKNEPFLKKYIG